MLSFIITQSSKAPQENMQQKQIYGHTHFVQHLLAKNCLFLLPLSRSAPSLPMFPLEFCGEVNHEETIESWGYPPVKTA